jgi:hypothetical protein
MSDGSNSALQQRVRPTMASGGLHRAGTGSNEGVLSRVLLTFHTPSIGFPYYTGCLSDFWSDHPQANRLGSLLTIGHVNSDALGLS